MKVLSSFSTLGKVNEAKIKMKIKMMLPLHVITLWTIMCARVHVFKLIWLITNPI